MAFHGEQLWFWERPYYWEFVDVDVLAIPRWKKSWHLTRWVGTKVFEGMEFAGEIFAELLGLNTSNYQWVIDTAEEDRRRKLQKEAIDQRRRELESDLRELRHAELIGTAEAGEDSGAESSEEEEGGDAAGDVDSEER